MKIKNPFQELKPVHGDSLIEMMQGAFWSMITLSLATFVLKYTILLMMAYNSCTIK